MFLLARLVVVRAKPLAFAIEDQLSDLALDDLKVAFPMRDIVSARLFDQELYASFLDDKAASS